MNNENQKKLKKEIQPLYLWARINRAEKYGNFKTERKKERQKEKKKDRTKVFFFFLQL